MDNVPEPLRAAATEEIRELLNIYEQQLPDSVQFVLLLQHILQISTTLRGAALQEASHRLRKTIYIPNVAKPTQFATFLAISLDKDIQIVMNSLEQPPRELESALRHSRYIKWHLKPTVVTGGDNGIAESLYKLASERSIPIALISDCINYWMPREQAAKITYVVPGDVELHPLQVKHGKIINEWWPFRYKTSQLFFESTIQHIGGLGLFDKADGQLVACVLKNDYDAVGHLFTIPERSNRGYGSTLAKAMTRRIAEEHKQHVHTFIVRNNFQSMKLFEKIGFIPVNRTKWHSTS